MRPVKMNRSERRTPYLSNTVKGGATQITPNGVAYDQDPTPETASGLVGAENALVRYAPRSWPGGNRSGE